MLLRFSANRAQAPRHMEEHREWIRRGFADGVFLLTGSLKPDTGGGVLAHGTSLADLRARLQDDPFVAQDVASAEIIEIAPSRTDERLAFLMG
ncbi:YciI family protein [Methylobacterium sp. ID0610]|uniref:YciI family protein n=1 Tax=Methylobacterium carpenticola TaxID=3344827 RepID=UPI0036B40BA3